MPITRRHLIGVLSALLMAGAPVHEAYAQETHPLDPLSADEISRTVEVIRGSGRFGSDARFATIDLAEPDKQQVMEDLRTGSLRRSARALAYDWATGTPMDIVVDLGAGRISSWTDLPSGDPPIRRLVIARLNEVAKADAEWRAAMADAGITDLDRVNVLASLPEDTPLSIENGERFVGGSPFMMDERPEAMGGPVAVRVNLTRGEVVDIFLSSDAWTPSSRTAPDRGRPPLAPLEITQPAGPGFSVEGSRIEWQNWRIRYGVHPRRGLELHDVAYEDNGEERSILYRAAVSETLTPYGDPEWPVWFPIDEGDYGFGIHGIRSAVPGADAPPNAVFRSATMHDHTGRPLEVPRAVTIYERDGGVLWRHAEESRRSRELVVAFYSAIDNYDYAFNWIFRQDGSMHVEVQLTGVINSGVTDLHRDTTAFAEDRRSYRTVVAPGVTGPIHQHFFSYRLDFDVDGTGNTVVESQAEADPVGPRNAEGLWFAARETVLARESHGLRKVNPASARSWRVVNEGRLNSLGQPTAYALVPKGNVVPAQASLAPSRRKMGFVDWHLWITPFRPDEMHAGGDLMEPGARERGLPTWVLQDRPLRDTDVVLWYTLGVTHQVRPEDYPIMPVHTAGFAIVPFGFFTENPAMDVGSR